MHSAEPSVRAITSFVLGLLSLGSLYACPLLPVLAIAFGASEREGLGRAGLILGWIGLAIYAVFAIGAFVLVILGGTAFAFTLE